MQRVRVGIIGVGNLGSRHAKLAAGVPAVELVGVMDTDGQRAEQVAALVNTRSFDTVDALFAEVDAVFIVTPTCTHAELALRAFDAGLHVFVEKPIAQTPDQARAMIRSAATTRRQLQVGHVERFNPAVVGMTRVVTEPRFIEAHRLGPLAPQVRDVGVVLDLMIHDLDLILWLVGEPVERVESVGVAVLTPHEDIANARIRFAGGCIANVTASRVTPEPQRKMRIFQPDAYLSLDFTAKRLEVYRKEGPGTGMAGIQRTVQELDLHNALEQEIASFAQCVVTGEPPRVTGADGLAALELATLITEQVSAGV